jgi:hypothetical protein
MASRLLLISYRFPPQSSPLALGLREVVNVLRRNWEIDVVTATKNASTFPNVTVHHVPERSFSFLQRPLRTLRLEKLERLLTWPDPYWPWIWPALRVAERIVNERQPSVGLIFMMPFSTGFVGTLLKARTGLPIVFNLNDSPTCSDMNPTFPSRLHYALSTWMEDTYVRTADRTVYVSRHNRDRVRRRHPEALRKRIRMVRCSADPMTDAEPPDVSREACFRIVYTGAMSGWYDLLPSAPSILKRLYHAWNRLGTYVRTPIDYRTHSPVYVGQAVKAVLDKHPEWQGRIRVELYGNTYPESVVNRVLSHYDLTEIVAVHGRVSHSDVHRITRDANLLFLTLPDRLDGSAGGRISLKTYEYLTTDRPILAAVPPGENHDFLHAKPGTYLTAPRDVNAMREVIEEQAAAHFGGHAPSFDRSSLQSSFSSATRAAALSTLLHEVARPAERLAPTLS